MSRTTFKVSMKTKSVDEVLQIIERTLKPVGYNEKNIDGEYVWAKGDGVFEKMQCLTTVFSENSVFIQGWTKSPFLGEVALEKNRADYSREGLDALIDYIRSSIY